MQDSSLYSQIKTQIQHPHPQFPEQEHLKCPRCDSTNTKFCYYNNYNLSQPRHFCKNCRRYWTKGGALRNIPVGGGSRKNSKRSSSSSSSSTATSAAAKRPAPAVSDHHNDNKNASGETKGDNFGGQFGNFMEMSGSFSSLLDSSGAQFGGLMDGLGPNGPNLQISGDFGDSGSGSGQNVGREMGLESGNGNNGDAFLSIEGGGETGSWDGSSNEWPDLAIYTPGSNFH
ncbi:hypothetical protein CDL12_22966 [Handroanthus impetiginosus]|uniref:Dof zinc finger protein n=1 Tax=Handroanthus impetiginosus TaxID=429701 RepID=A0A2G9GGT2_9LAMI|nr:hypothetical protein CDL12_24911 [Handroanthus impetiginosus]PIN04503.1 hypothetical protein CDL12_22966 [Handroanthus impetiginosus]